MDKIECLVCEDSLNLPHYIDTNDYDGHVVCKKCKAILYIKFVEGRVKKYKIIKNRRAGEPVEIRIVEEPPPFKQGDK